MIRRVRQRLCALIIVGILGAVGQNPLHAQPAGEAGEISMKDVPLQEIQLPSSIDGTMQKSLVWIPESAKTEERPVLVFLHSWSGGYRQNNMDWVKLAAERNWIVLHPDFRGPNSRPEACGSELAQQDILDVLDWAQKEYKVDLNRVYLAGGSGGGHMSLLMAGRHPHRFSAVSSWCPITDLVEWHRFHVKDGVAGNYAKMMEKSCGGAPGTSPAVDLQYKNRSPRVWIKNIGDLPVDINAGVHDGHTGSVPVRHSLWAFNEIAKAVNAPVVTEDEMEQLWADLRLKNPQPGDTAEDVEYGMPIYLRRTAGTARVTIFEGGHVAVPAPAIAWLEKQSRLAQTATQATKQ